mmetsp:Transcript_13053/g.23175  ORF Transcript_13053/g.23175 Transcript_13053/m.23175 type:complete len:87 (+) Transcript_13053:118-378(+)
MPHSGEAHVKIADSKRERYVISNSRQQHRSERVLSNSLKHIIKVCDWLGDFTNRLSLLQRRRQLSTVARGLHWTGGMRGNYLTNLR